MAVNRRVSGWIVGSLILVSAAVANGVKKQPALQAHAIEAVSQQDSKNSSQRKDLDAAIEELTNAEQKKSGEPREYISALLNVATDARNYDVASQNLSHPYDSRQGDEYFKRAVDFYCNTKLKSEDNLLVAQELWNSSSQTSSTLFESVFEQIFKASQSNQDETRPANDSSVWFAIKQHEEKLPLSTQKKLLARTIDIRSAALGRSSKQLAPLYQNMAFCCLENSDTEGAEKNFQQAISLLEPDPIEHLHAIVNLAVFYANNQLYDKSEITWKRAVTLLKEKHLEWYTDGFRSLIEVLRSRGQFKRMLPIFQTWLADGDDFTFRKLDPLLAEFIDNQMKFGEFAAAEAIVERRIAVDSSNGKTSGSEDWKVRLSDLYLADGKTEQSEAIFKRVISDLEARSLPTSSLKHKRSTLLANLGMRVDSQQRDSSISSTSSDIVLSSSIVVKDHIEFAKDVGITSFDSTDPNDPIGRNVSSGGYGGAFVTTSGDPSSILCLGSITGRFVQYLGTVFCNNVKTETLPNRELKVLPVPQAVHLEDCTTPSSDAKTSVVMLDGHEKVLERGDYILTDLGRLTVRPQASSLPIRLFLEDSPGKEDFELSLEGPPVSFRQFQLWYKGNKQIKIKNGSGLIYAPNASVEIDEGPGFMGVLVAREFKYRNSASIFLDRGVVNISLSR